MSGFDSNGLLATYCVASPIGTATTLAGTFKLPGRLMGPVPTLLLLPTGAAVDGGRQRLRRRRQQPYDS